MILDTLLIFVTAFVALVVVLIALAVLLKDTSSWINRWLFIFLLSAGAWSTLVSFQNHFPPGVDVWLVRTVFVTAVATCASAYAFAKSLSTKKVGIGTVDLLIVLGSWTLCYLPGLVVVDFTIQNGAAKVGYGFVYPAVLVIIVYFLARSILSVIKLWRGGTPESRLQAKIIAAGLSLGFVSGMLTNAILPNILRVSSSSRFAFVALILWSSLLTFAIVQHHFLDIRPVVARAVTYVLSLASVAIVYVLIVSIFTFLLFSSSDLGNAVFQPQYFVALVLSAATFGPVSRFFNRLTRKIFFKDAYDPQVVLDRLGSLLARTVDISEMKAGAKSVIQNALNPQSIRFYLLNNASSDESISDDLVSRLRRTDNILVSDGQTDRITAELMRKEDIAVLIGLRTSRQTVGYLAIGYRRSGYAYSKQDINLLKTAGDQIAIALQNGLQFQEISGFNATLRQEVKDATAQLRSSNSKLRKLDEAKDEFISMASHQLRTPLTSVKGYISMALEGDAGKLNDQQRKLLEEAFMSAQRMVYLIGDFLNVSRIQTGKFMLELRPINLAVLVQEEVNQLLTTSQRRNIKLDYHQPHGFPALMLDEDKMRQVVMNFVDNAIYYSRPDSAVKIELLATANDVQLRVKDTGIGVPEKERPHLFTKFYRAENARKVRPDGTGVGLFMAKKVITAHGGSIIFESQMGKGSTFGFSLPISAVAVPKGADATPKEQPIASAKISG